jgi:hypothetical protein
MHILSGYRALSSTFFLEAAFAGQCALLVPWQPLKINRPYF